MPEQKRPQADDDVVPPSNDEEAQAPGGEAVDGGFFAESEHDGWGPIKRRTPAPPEPKGVL